MKKPVYIIAEAGVNHNGSVEMAKQLVDVAVDAGADAVKFQSFVTERLVSKFAPKADYQLDTTDKKESQFEMLKKLELSFNSQKVLYDYCAKKKIKFLSTPFDNESLDFLATDLKVDQIKIASSDITNAFLLLRLARHNKAAILSTGMSSMAEIETALGVLAYGYINSKEIPSQKVFEEAYFSEDGRRALSDKVILLHCTAEYPSPFEDLNLCAIQNLAMAFQLPVGFSDHTPGIAAPVAAVSLGAGVIEKHFTLDKNLPGPDQRASLNPQELKEMVQAIRMIEKALGSAQKLPRPSEKKNRPIARKSLVAACAIKKGDVFTSENLEIKRPGSGILPIFYWEWLGRKAQRDYKEDELIDDNR